MLLLLKVVEEGETLAAMMSSVVEPAAVSSKSTSSVLMKSVAVAAVWRIQLLLAPVVPVCQLPLSEPVHLGESPEIVKVMALPVFARGEAD